MKNIFIQLLSLSILIASLPLMPNNAFALEGCDSQEHLEKKAICDENPALRWDSDRCDCIDNEDNDEFNKKFNQCAENEEYDEKERQYCYSNNGLEAAGLSQCGALFEDQGEGETEAVGQGDAKKMNQCMDSMGYSGALQSWTSSMAMINAVLGIIMFIVQKNKDKDSNMCWATKIMTAASIVGIANELINYFFFEQEIRQLQVDYYQEALCDTTLANDSNSLSSEATSLNETDTSEGCSGKPAYDAQSEAFRFLIDERSATKKMLLKKAIGYTISAALFFIASLSAIIQIATSLGTGAAASCYVADASPIKEKSSTDIIFQQLISALINKFLIPPSFAKRNKSNYSSNIMNGSIKGWGHFLKWEHYRCELKPKGEGYGTHQTTVEDYNKCMECMRAQTNKSLSSNDDSESKVSGCSKYVRGLSEQPLLRALFSSLILGGGAYLAAPLIPAKKTINGLGKMMAGQAVLALVSAILSGFSAGVMYAGSAEARTQEKDLIDVQEQFLGAIALRCPNGREDQNDPPCYCFNEDGSRRDDRTKAEGCQKLYAELDQRFDLESGDLFMGQSTSQLGCVAIDGSPDPNCDCQKFTDQKSGKNACYQVPLATGVLGNIMTGTGADQSVNGANTITGANNGGSISSPSSLLNAVRNLVDVNKKMLKNLNGKLKSKGKAPLEISGNKIAAIVQGVSTPKLRSLAKQQTSVSTSSSKAMNAVKKAKKRIKKTKAKFTGGKGLAFNKSSDKKNGLNFDFEGNSRGGRTKNFMNKKYKYKKDDVVKNSGASIWKVITNRYNNSAYNRLFEE